MSQQAILQEEELRNELVTFFGMEKLAPEDQAKALDKMMEALVKTIFLGTLQKLGEEGADNYEKLLERGAEPEEIARFLESRIPGYNVFVKEIVSDFKHEMLGALQK